MNDREKTSHLEIASGEDDSIVISGNIPNLHDDPEKIHRLLDLLGMPSGTQVRVVTKAASVIVR